MITELEFVRDKLPVYSDEIHKGNRGKVLIIGGSTGLTGAVCMAANAALRSGAGLISVAVPESLNNIFEIKLTEVMSLPVADKNGEFISDAKTEILAYASSCDAIAFGPGSGVSDDIFDILEHLILFYRKKIIIDADGLNALSVNTNILKKAKADILITPHAGEMARLTGKSIEEVVKNRENISYKFASDYNVSVLLKGKNTIITNGKQTFINPTGNNGMAKGGSGDVLTGICVSMASQGLNCFDSGIIGAYIHGMAGDIARDKLSDFYMAPTDIIDNLGNAYKKIKKV